MHAPHRQVGVNCPLQFMRPSYNLVHRVPVPLPWQQDSHPRTEGRGTGALFVSSSGLGKRAMRGQDRTRVPSGQAGAPRPHHTDTPNHIFRQDATAQKGGQTRVADAQEHTPDETEKLKARIAELESQLQRAEQQGADAKAAALEKRIAALEERLEDSEPLPVDAEPAPDEGVVLDADPDNDPSESGGEQSPGNPPAPRVHTQRVGGRWRTWTEEPEDSPANA